MILPRENRDDCVDMKYEGILPNDQLSKGKLCLFL